MCYKNGYGVSKDRDEAEKWYKLAADLGDDIAKAHLKSFRG